MDYEARLELLQLIEEKERRKARRKLGDYYPDAGDLRRELYPQHLKFFKAGKEYRERCFMAANRIGKTEGVGGYETTLHLTGRYPDWWEGFQFKKPIKSWIAGKTTTTTRDIIQAKLFGEVAWKDGRKTFSGTGLIPGDTIEGVTWKQGVNDLADTVKIRHVSGKSSLVGLRYYEQGRGAFEGTEQDLIWLDEEPPEDIYSECLIRTMTTNGLVLCTFTPLEGMSRVVQSFLADDVVRV